MMDYKEMAEIVKARGEEQIAKKAARTRRIKRITLSVTELAAAAAAVICVWHSGLAEKDPPVLNDGSEIVYTTTTAESTSSAAGTTIPASGTIGSSTGKTVMTTKAAEAQTTAVRTQHAADTASGAGAEKTAAASVQGSRASAEPAKTAAVRGSQTQTAPAEQTPETTTVTPIKKEEEIRMKVETIKRYLAVLSAAALSSSGGTTAYAEKPIYEPKERPACVESYRYVRENEDMLDFNGSGAYDVFDNYALYVYLHEPEELPEGYRERCEKNGDVTQDGNIDGRDMEILYEHWAANYLQDSLAVYREGVQAHKILYKNKLTSEDEYSGWTIRYLSPDCTPEEREKYSNEYVHESYTYGSEDGLIQYIDILLDITHNIYGSVLDKYSELWYSDFEAEADSDPQIFDLNGDGAVDMKDAYDLYISNMCLPEDSPYRADNYHDQFLKEKTSIRDTINIDGAELDALEAKCIPLYEMAEKIYGTNGNIQDIILRYIMSKTELGFENLLSSYYIDYRGELTACEINVADTFLWEADGILKEYYENPTYTGSSEKLDKSMEIDAAYMFNNELMRSLFKVCKESFESGDTWDLYDLNKDGEVDAYDAYVCDEYLSDLFKGTPREYSVIPDDIWEYLDEKLDLDKDGLAGDYVDCSIVKMVIMDSGFEELSQYEKDKYFLELLEKKNISTTAEASKFMAKVCGGKNAGDVDLDGTVTAADATEVLVYYSDMSVKADISVIQEAKMDRMADINGDGSVDCADATDILQTYAENSVK